MSEIDRFMRLPSDRQVLSLVLISLGLYLVLRAAGGLQHIYIPGGFEMLEITGVKRDSSGVLVITLKNTGDVWVTLDGVALNGTFVSADRLSFGWNSTFKSGEERVIMVDGRFTPGMRLDVSIRSESGNRYTRTITL